MTEQLIHKKSRAFNEVIIDKKYSRVIKKSSDFEKLACEANWYGTDFIESLPSELLPFVPRVLKVNSPSEESLGSIELEYCPYPVLSELFVNKVEVDWKRILKRLLEIHEMFTTPYNSSLLEDVKAFHLQKSKQRFEELKKLPVLSSVLKCKEIVINGEVYKNIDFDKILEDLECKLCYASLSIVHGDYCFSNILYDLNSDCVKLIDPRGYLLDKKKPTPFGDPNYDFAKLMHSVHGLYDYIVAGKYSLIAVDANRFSFKIGRNVPLGLLTLLRDASPNMQVYAYRCLLEVLLFLTMIPLHWEDPQRQLAFYLRAIQLYRSYQTINGL